MTSSTFGSVLVVEDDDSMREAIETLLDAAGFESALFASAESMLAGGVGAGVACVVSDFKLPGMSGLDLLTELRRRSRRPPVILITAHDSEALRAEAERRGAAAYLAKPFLGSVLLTAIARVAADNPTSAP